MTNYIFSFFFLFTEPQFDEFNFAMNHLGFEKTHLQTTNIQQTSNTTKKTDFDPWQSPQIFDEEENLSQSPKPSMLTDETMSLFQVNTSQTMNLEDDTPPLDFQEDFLKFSKIADDQQETIKKFYEEKKPLPNILVPTSSINHNIVNSQEEDLPMVSIISNSQNTYCSQEPTVNPMDMHTDINYNQQLEHNYTKEEDKVKNLVADKKVPILKIKIPRQVQEIQQYETKVASTPEITNQILDLEKQFDLVQYIDSSNVSYNSHFFKKNHFTNNVNDFFLQITATVVQPIEIKEEPEFESEEQPTFKRKSSISIDELRGNHVKTPKYYNTRTRCSSPSTSTTSEYINPGSIQSTTSDDSYSPSISRSKTTKKRGRPAKPVMELIDPTELANLSPDDLRYRELRNKNNEASRRSRLNRRDREVQLEEEAAELEQEYASLERKYERLLKNHDRWKDMLMKVALL